MLDHGQMAVRVIDNSEEYIRGLGQSRRKSHVLELSNVMEYAGYLQDRHGYYVFNDERIAKDVVDWLSDLVASNLPLSDRNIEQALDGAGYEVINFFQSLTSKMRPPVKAGQGPRRAHPGGWADVTRNLANAYRHTVNGGRVVTHG